MKKFMSVMLAWLIGSTAMLSCSAVETNFSEDLKANTLISSPEDFTSSLCEGNFDKTLSKETSPSGSTSNNEKDDKQSLDLKSEGTSAQNSNKNKCDWCKALKFIVPVAVSAVALVGGYFCAKFIKQKYFEPDKKLEDVKPEIVTNRFKQEENIILEKDSKYSKTDKKLKISVNECYETETGCEAISGRKCFYDEDLELWCNTSAYKCYTRKERCLKNYPGGCDYNNENDCYYSPNHVKQ